MNIPRISAILMTLVLGCKAATPVVEVNPVAIVDFSDPVQVGAYTFHFGNNLSESTVSKVTDFAKRAQEKIPQLVFSANFYVFHRYAGTGNQAEIMGGMFLVDGDLHFYVTPYFHRRSRNYQEVVVLHEMVHAKLFLMGLSDTDNCQLSVHEHIAYAVALKFQKNQKEQRQIKSRVDEYSAYVHDRCKLEDYSRFYQEFEEYM